MIAVLSQPESYPFTPPPEARLVLRLLGQVQVTLDGQPLALAYDKLLALLAVLAVEPGGMHRREALADLLWPEHEPAAARHNLSQALFHLRRLGGSEAAPPLLLTTREDVRLDPSAPIWVDVAAFRGIADEHTHAPELEAAAALYRGPLLEGFSIGDSADFEEWVQRTGEPLRLRACALLERLSAPDTGVPGADRACSYARRWVAIDPLDEAAHRRLMAALARTGQRTAALVQFEHCRRLLEQELGVAPEPETIALYEHLRQHAPSESRVPSAPVQAGLPPPPERLFGRDADRAELAAALADPGQRLITIVGPGGVGKTSLALTLAREHATSFADGAAWVQLAPLREPAQVIVALARALELPPADAQPAEEQVRHALAARHLLLLLDNCEHLLPDLAALVADLLATAPRLVILATSRSPLNLSREWRHQLAPLALPREDQPPAAQLTSAAVALFIERARAVRPELEFDLSAIGAICRALDGLPLAVELAATRARLLSPRELLARLDRRLPLLNGGPRDLPERQQTLAAAIDWSYQLLSPMQQAVFRRLAVFAGGWTIEAAEIVCADLCAGDSSTGLLDVLEALLDASLIVDMPGASGAPRCTMLETIAEFAREQLAAHHELDQARAAHARALAAFAAEACVGLDGPGQWLWIQRVDAEGENVRAALAWCHTHAIGTGLRLLSDLGRSYVMCGQRREGRDWVERLLAATAPPGWPAPTVQERAHGQLISGTLSTLLHDLQLATARLEASEAQFRTLGDDEQRAAALNGLGNIALQRRSYPEAERYYRHALALRRKIAHTAGIAGSLANLGMITMMQGDGETAQTYYRQSLPLYQQVGDRANVALVMARFATLLAEQSEYREARELYEASHAIALELGSKPVIWQTLHGLGTLERLQGRYAAAKAFFRRSAVIPLEGQYWGGLALDLLAFAVIACEEGRIEGGAVLLGAIAALTTSKQLAYHPSDQAELERFTARARAGLEPTAFDAAWLRGQALPPEQAVAYARADDQDGQPPELSAGQAPPAAREREPEPQLTAPASQGRQREDPDGDQ